MADPSTNLRVRISADLADIKQGLGVLRGDLAAVKRQAATALPDTSKFTAGLGNARRALTGLFAGISAGALFAGVKANTKEAEEAVAQLRAGLKSTGGVAGVTVPEILDLAAALQKVTTFGDDTIVRMASVVATFTNIRGAIFKDAIPAILDLSTRLGTDLNSAAIQVGKALNDPIKGITALGRAGVQFTGEQKTLIKGFVETGRLQEAQKIILAELTRQMGGSATAAADTFSGSVSQLSNAVGDLLEGDSSAGGMAEAKESVRELTAVMQDAGTKRAFADLLTAVARGTTALVNGVRGAMPFIRELIQNLDAVVVYLGVRFAGAAVAGAVAGFARLAAIIRTASTATIALRGALLLLGGPIGIAVAALAAGIYYLYQRTDQAKVAAEAHTKALAANADMARNDAKAALQDANAKRALAIETLNSAKALLAERRARFAGENTSRTARGGDRGDSAAFASTMALQRQQKAVDQARKEVEDWTRQVIGLQLEIQQTEISAGSATVAGFDIVTSGADKTKKAVKGVIDQSALAQDEIKRELEALEALYERAGISIADYYAKKQALQLADIDAQIRQQEQEAKTATSSDQQSRAMTEIVRLQRERATIGVKAAADQAKAEEDLTKQLGEVHIKLLQLQGETGRAAALELEEQYRDLLVKLQANPEFTKAGYDLVRKVINLEAADAQLQQFEAKMQEVMGRLQGLETSASAQTEAGLLSPFEAERQLQAARATSLQQLIDLRQAASDYLATLSADNPAAQGVLDFLTQVDANLAQVSASQRRLAQQAAQVAINSLTTFFTDLASGTKSAGDALKDFVRSFVAGMAEIAARALATYLVLQLLDAIYPGLGKATAATMSAGQHHSGGIAGRSGGVRREVSPLLFGAAPRYHGGGIAGLGQNEVPAILERGEEVLTRNDPRHRDNAGRGQGSDRVIVKQPILAFGDRQFADAMANSRGVEDVVVTIIENNWERLNRAAV